MGWPFVVWKSGVCGMLWLSGRVTGPNFGVGRACVLLVTVNHVRIPSGSVVGIGYAAAVIAVGAVDAVFAGSSRSNGCDGDIDMGSLAFSVDADADVAGADLGVVCELPGGVAADAEDIVAEHACERTACGVRIDAVSADGSLGGASVGVFVVIISGGTGFECTPGHAVGPNLFGFLNHCQDVGFGGGFTVVQQADGMAIVGYGPLGSVPVGPFLAGDVDRGGLGRFGLGRLGGARSGVSGISRAARVRTGVSGGFAGIVDIGRRRGGGRVLHHSVNHDAALAPVHDVIAPERSVGVSGDNPQGEHVLHGVLVLARDVLVIRNFLLRLGLLRGRGGESLFGHDVGHEAGHVIPGNCLVHDRGIQIAVLEAGAVENLVVIQRFRVGGEPGQFPRGVRIFFDVSGIEGPGEHDAKLCAGDGVGRSERPVGVAGRDALGGAVHDGRVEAVGAGYVGEAGHGGKEFVVGGGGRFGFNGNCFHAVLGLYGNVGQAGFDALGVSAAVIAIEYDAGVVTGIESVVGTVGFGGERCDGHGKHHEKRECGRERAADGNAVLDSHRKYLTFTKKFN